MTIRQIALAAIVALAAGSAAAQELKPIQAKPIDLGAVTGIAYYTVEPTGYRVVATLGQANEEVAPVRVDVTLAPGQNVTLSSPRAAGSPADTVVIAREADTVVVRKPDGTLTN
jgi:hypothetical protein